MATYIYTTWLQKKADLSPVAAVDWRGMHTQGEWPGETHMNKRQSVEDWNWTYEPSKAFVCSC